MDGGNLEDLLLVKNDVAIPWNLRFRFVQQMAKALAYIHCSDGKQPYIHGDMKSQNILLTSGFHIKIGDLGSASIARITGASQQSNACRSKACTLIYAAPEVINYHKATCASDMYRYV